MSGGPVGDGDLGRVCEFVGRATAEGGGGLLDGCRARGAGGAVLDEEGAGAGPRVSTEKGD